MSETPHDSNSDPMLSEEDFQAAFDAVLARPDGEADSKFGTSMLILAVFTLVGGAYPIATTAYTRAITFLAGIMIALIAAYYIDRSKCRSRGKPTLKSADGADKADRRPRRVK